MKNSITIIFVFISTILDAAAFSTGIVFTVMAKEVFPIAPWAIGVLGLINLITLVFLMRWTPN